MELPLPASQSLINIRPPKPLLVIYIFSKFGTLFFSQNTWYPPLSFQILSCNPLLPRKSKPSPSPKSKPKNPKLRCRWCCRGSYEQSENSNAASKASFGIFLRFFFKIYLTIHGWYNPKNQNFFLWILLHIAIWLKYLFWVFLYFLFLFSFVECKLCVWWNASMSCLWVVK